MWWEKIGNQTSPNTILAPLQVQGGVTVFFGLFQDPVLDYSLPMTGQDHSGPLWHSNSRPTSSEHDELGIRVKSQNDWE